MKHASVELIEAIAGLSPYFYDASAEDERCLRPGYGFRACDASKAYAVEALVHAATAIDDREPRDIVDCPECLRLMREAMDPVRWDALEERGLTPKLEAA